MIPEACQYYYENEQAVVAVVPFSNLSAQDNKNQKESLQTKVTSSSQLGGYAQAAVESAVVKMGLATVVSRKELDKVLAEQHFQMAISNPESMVEMGKLLDAKYIITCSINNINFKSQKIETEMTVNIIDVSTGKIIATHKSEGDESFRGEPSYEKAISTTKAALASGLEKTFTFMKDVFELTAYVQEVRGNKTMALINLGRKDGVRQGDVFVLLILNEHKDFKTGRSICTVKEDHVRLLVTEHMGEDFAWLTEEFSSGINISFMKRDIYIGSIVKRAPRSRFEKSEY